MSLFKKDPPAQKPSFSNVKKGSSSSADGTYTANPGVTPQHPAGPQTTPKATRGADFSNVRSGASSTAPTREPAERSTYTVRSGDSLSKIARRHYGDAKEWTRIYEANQELIGKDPDLIQPGQVLVLPPS